eukprot:CAMPEP_0174861052 /NCGR_PEP_ID=MMETSP1114-20130205/50705_1 /TAXON_ID=312471 /ORGANISM="Neobodo designis, Strain CCAP 1951/1" /LENGTH=692 /DNA_ID=CAMNT_0016096047 /DNA_START=41 /DNA_END=2116 /DNA_ORIENTATION=-
MKLVAVAATLLLCVIAVPATAQQTVNCQQWLSASSGAFPLRSFMTCLNSTSVTPANVTLAAEVINMVKTGVLMHTLGPYVPDTLAAVNALNPNDNSRTVAQVLIDIERALGGAKDLHLALSGTPKLDSYFVIRLFQISVRASSAGGQELYVRSIQTQSTIDAYRNFGTLQGGTFTIPTFATHAAALNKTIRSINGMDAMDWARREVTYTGFFTPSMRLNLGVMGQFMFRVSQTVDLVSEGEVVEFTDGSTLSYPRIVIKGGEGSSPRCDVSNRNSAASRRRQSAPIRVPGMQFASEHSLNLELEDTSIEAFRRIGEPAAAVATAVAAIDAGQRAGAVKQNRVNSVSDSVIFSREYSGLGKFQILNRAQGAVAVLTINTFLPPPVNGGSFSIRDIQQIHNNISALTREARNRNVEELMIDVSSNPGGYVALHNLYLRELDNAYNLNWDPSTVGDDDTPDLINVTNQNVLWSRSYLRRSIQSQPIGKFYENLLNKTSVYLEGSNSHIVPGTPVWFDPVGRTRDGWTGAYIRPSLFTVDSAERVFRRIKIVGDGVCGSSCCLFVERIKEWGIVGANVEFVAFGGDTSEATFQLGDACGGSVNRFCAAWQVANLSAHPHLTGTGADHSVDISFVDAAYFRTTAESSPAQYSMRAFANRVIRDWDALGSSDEAHERRVQWLYGASVASPASTCTQFA